MTEFDKVVLSESYPCWCDDEMVLEDVAGVIEATVDWRGG